MKNQSLSVIEVKNYSVNLSFMILIQTLNQYVHAFQAFELILIAPFMFFRKTTISSGMKMRVMPYRQDQIFDDFVRRAKGGNCYDSLISPMSTLDIQEGIQPLANINYSPSFGSKNVADEIPSEQQRYPLPRTLSIDSNDSDAVEVGSSCSTDSSLHSSPYSQNDFGREGFEETGSPPCLSLDKHLQGVRGENKSYRP